MKYADILGELVLQDWIDNIYKIQITSESRESDKIDSEHVYTIRFKDGSSIVGRVESELDMFEYTQVTQGFIDGNVTMSEKFINFVHIKISSEYPTKDFIEEMYDHFNESIVSKVKEALEEGEEEVQNEITKEYLKKCMLDAADREDFETASRLQKKLKEL